MSALSCKPSALAEGEDVVNVGVEMLFFFGVGGKPPGAFGVEPRLIARIDSAEEPGASLLDEIGKVEASLIAAVVMLTGYRLDAREVASAQVLNRPLDAQLVPVVDQPRSSSISTRLSIALSFAHRTWTHRCLAISIYEYTA